MSLYLCAHVYYSGEKAVIERMKALRAEGMGFDRIAQQLNDQQIKPRRGKRWWGLTVNKILTGKEGRKRTTATLRLALGSPAQAARDRRLGCRNQIWRMIP